MSLSGNLKFGQPSPRPDQIIIMLGLILSKSNVHRINRSRECPQIGQSPNNISRVLTRILEKGVKLLSFGKVWSFTIFLYLDFWKSWSRIKKSWSKIILALMDKMKKEMYIFIST